MNSWERCELPGSGRSRPPNAYRCFQSEKRHHFRQYIDSKVAIVDVYASKLVSGQEAYHCGLTLASYSASVLDRHARSQSMLFGGPRPNLQGDNSYLLNWRIAIAITGGVTSLRVRYKYNTVLRTERAEVFCCCWTNSDVRGTLVANEVDKNFVK